MPILIAESKTMRNPELKVSDSVLKNHIPIFNEDAEIIAASLAASNIAEISKELKITPSLAQKVIKLAYDFPNKEMSDKSISLFTGDVFKSLLYHTLSLEAGERLYSEVKIISSLYGLLKPDDMIKPYRLEFKAAVSPDNNPLNKFWKKKVTIALGKELKENTNPYILNLLPGDAAACIDFKLIKAFAKVIKPDFRILTYSGEIRNPYTAELKSARGAFLREILEKNIPLNNLEEFESDDFIIDHDLSKPGLPVYIRNQKNQ